MADTYQCSRANGGTTLYHCEWGKEAITEPSLPLLTEVMQINKMGHGTVVLASKIRIGLVRYNFSFGIN